MAFEYQCLFLPSFFGKRYLFFLGEGDETEVRFDIKCFKLRKYSNLDDNTIFDFNNKQKRMEKLLIKMKEIYTTLDATKRFLRYSGLAD